MKAEVDLINFIDNQLLKEVLNFQLSFIYNLTFMDLNSFFQNHSEC